MKHSRSRSRADMSHSCRTTDSQVAQHHQRTHQMCACLQQPLSSGKEKENPPGKGKPQLKDQKRKNPQKPRQLSTKKSPSNKTVVVSCTDMQVCRRGGGHRECRSTLPNTALEASGLLATLGCQLDWAVKSGLHCTAVVAVGKLDAAACTEERPTHHTR